jgi:3-oxoacyl-[acyl-carrier protein] reductase
MSRFDGKCVVVTGGVSGIGEAVSKAFAREGACVVLGCLPGEAAGTKVLEELQNQGTDCILVEGDISQKQSVENLVESAVRKYEKIHTFVSNAAAFDYYKPLLETDEDLWNRVSDVNLRGNFFIGGAVLPHMIEHGGGNLIFISSIAGLIGGHGGAAYTTTKHGIIGLCKQITFDYGAKGIRCNVVCPGSIYTPLSGKFLDMPTAKEKLSKTPYGTHGLPEDVAGSVLYLASDDAKFVYGHALLIDGGNLIRKW